MDSGTGCVHTAPGFGADDFATCSRYGIEMVVPVDDQGRHTAYAATPPTPANTPGSAPTSPTRSSSRT